MGGRKKYISLTFSDEDLRLMWVEMRTNADCCPDPELHAAYKKLAFKFSNAFSKQVAAK